MASESISVFVVFVCVNSTRHSQISVPECVYTSLFAQCQERSPEAPLMLSCSHWPSLPTTVGARPEFHSVFFFKPLSALNSRPDFYQCSVFELAASIKTSTRHSVRLGPRLVPLSNTRAIQRGPGKTSFNIIFVIANTVKAAHRLMNTYSYS